MSLRPGCSWSATTSGTRDGSGVPSGADESVPNHDCRYNPSRLQPTARRMRPPCGDQTGAPPNAARPPSSTIVGESYSRSPTIPPGASWAQTPLGARLGVPIASRPPAPSGCTMPWAPRRAEDVLGLCDRDGVDAPPCLPVALAPSGRLLAVGLVVDGCRSRSPRPHHALPTKSVSRG